VSHRLFVGGMDVRPGNLIAADINRHGLSRGGEFECLGLRLTQARPLAVNRDVTAAAVIRQLSPEEGKRGLSELLAPVVDERGEEGVIVLRRVGVGLALIPDDAPVWL
jgi:hypothetical protein